MSAIYLLRERNDITSRSQATCISDPYGLDGLCTFGKASNALCCAVLLLPPFIVIRPSDQGFLRQKVHVRE